MLRLFASPQFLWLFAALPAFFSVWLILGKRGSHTLKNTMVSLIKIRSGWSKMLDLAIRANKVLLWGILALLMAEPAIPIHHQALKPAAKTLEVQDTSASMLGNPTDANEVYLSKLYDPNLPVTRITASFGAIKIFLSHTEGTDIAFTCFDDAFYYLYPFTNNNDMIVELMPQVEHFIETHNGGTNYDGPTIGVPDAGLLQGAIDVFKDVDATIPHIFIVTTDGDAPINDQRAEYFKKEFKRLNIHMFVFGVGEDWANDADDVQAMKEFVKSVGGKVVPVADAQGFNTLVREISDLQHSKMQLVITDESNDPLPLLLSIACGSFVIWLLLAALRRSRL